MTTPDDKKPAPFKFIGAIADPNPVAPEPPAKKPVVRRRPAGVKPRTYDEGPKLFPRPEPRPMTSHDLYMTYDSKGRLITHTVYKGPLPKKPVALVFPHSKKHKKT